MILIIYNTRVMQIYEKQFQGRRNEAALLIMASTSKCILIVSLYLSLILYIKLQKAIKFPVQA